MYYTGFLLADRKKVLALAPDWKIYSDNLEVQAIQNEAWRLYITGVVTLVQQRLGPGKFAYIAVKL